MTYVPERATLCGCAIDVPADSPELSSNCVGPRGRRDCKKCGGRGWYLDYPSNPAILNLKVSAALVEQLSKQSDGWSEPVRLRFSVDGDRLDLTLQTCDGPTVFERLLGTTGDVVDESTEIRFAVSSAATVYCSRGEFDRVRREGFAYVRPYRADPSLVEGAARFGNSVSLFQCNMVAVMARRRRLGAMCVLDRRYADDHGLDSDAKLIDFARPTLVESLVDAAGRLPTIHKDGGGVRWQSSD